MNKLIIINGSPRTEAVSNTYKALMAEKKFYEEKYPELIVKYFHLPVDMQGCINCVSCKEYCNVKDCLQEILIEMKDASDILIGSPVYLDMPTPQTVAFLTRLNCMAENTNRDFFRNKRVHLLATGFCSGTKTCIHTMMGACEMLGFTIEGRSTREYIVKWNDKKLRGGMTIEDSVWLE